MLQYDKARQQVPPTTIAIMFAERITQTGLRDADPNAERRPFKTHR